MQEPREDLLVFRRNHVPLFVNRPSEWAMFLSLVRMREVLGIPRDFMKDNARIRGGCISELQTHPNLDSPVLSRVKRRSSPSERVQIWVCLFLYGWYYPGVTLQIWVGLICVISPSFRPTQTGLCKFGWVWSSLSLQEFGPCTKQSGSQAWVDSSLEQVVRASGSHMTRVPLGKGRRGTLKDLVPSGQEKS